MTSPHAWPPGWSVADFLDDQHGVVSRTQLLASGETPAGIRRLIRRRELSVVHPGVYLDHTGEPHWLQRAWAAVLHAWPAALAGEAALRAHEGPGKRPDPVTVEVFVARSRTVLAPPGVRIRRVDGLARRTVWSVGPPRVRYDDAAIDVACRAASDLEALGVLAGVVQGRRSTAGRLAAELGARERAPRQAWLAGVLTDIAEGSCSVLEHGYLTRVVRPHGLPPGDRQVRDAIGSRIVYRDCEHEDGLVVELDGRLFHDSAQGRDLDMERDLDAALAGKHTVRIGWGQVFDRSCVTAVKVAALHRSRGWAGTPQPCGHECGIGATR
ncbi:type IV toxin-antitoxin system AbiEi family antitoxin domain-containing protein [Nocardioides sediminis]|uniref:type IV toxin-antitoxin system AbiEi family antitoxin domain-containing protein n=1 Tax=Nocardioides sediminis TaxID=433648 RepID=UPI000D31FA5A|nr:type IV toxin-antitoxin system AbiEi family antitoxin domain-containing protein [Nocardioides sediminis]